LESLINILFNGITILEKVTYSIIQTFRSDVENDNVYYHQICDWGIFQSDTTGCCFRRESWHFQAGVRHSNQTHLPQLQMGHY